MKRSSGNFNLSSHGLRAWLPGVLLLLLLFVINRRLTRMTSLNKIAANVYGLLLDNGFDPDTAKILTAQAAHETGNFTSIIFRENNNCFGMKLPKQRKTLATGENRGHAVFSSIIDSVGDFWLWYKSAGLPDYWNDIETYIKSLKMRGYFEDNQDNYLRGVKKFHKLYFGE